MFSKKPRCSIRVMNDTDNEVFVSISTSIAGALSNGLFTLFNETSSPVVLQPAKSHLWTRNQNESYEICIKYVSDVKVNVFTNTQDGHRYLETVKEITNCINILEVHPEAQMVVKVKESIDSFSITKITEKSVEDLDKKSIQVPPIIIVPSQSQSQSRKNTVSYK